MKKLFLIGLAATAMLASCSNDETVEMAQNNRTIQFDGFVNKSTRGVNDDILNSNFSKFQVWGLMQKGTNTGIPFVGTEVSKTDKWSYTTPVYWENGYNYSFVAIAPAADNWKFTAPTVVGQYGSIAFENGEGTTDLIYDVDGLYATNPVSTETVCPAPISFTFNHLLSRVKFTFKNGMDDGSLINVTGVEIGNANTKAVATLDENSTWALASDNEASKLSFGDILLSEGESSFTVNETRSTDHKYMIPVLAENQAYQVTFIVERKHHGVTDTYTHTVTIPAKDCAFESGKSYNFVAELTALNINPETPLCPIE